MKGLIFVNGLTREIIEAKLTEAGIKYRIRENKRRNPFVRDTDIEPGEIVYPPLIREERDKLDREITSLFGFPERYQNGDKFYYGFYKITPKFDRTQLEGKISFREGLLMERIHFYPA